MPPTAPGIPGAWSPTEAISFGWNAVMKNFAGVALPIAVAGLVSALPGGILGGVWAVVEAILRENLDSGVVTLIAIIARIITNLIGIAVGSYIAGGMVGFALKVARGQPAQFGDVFSGGQYFGRIFLVSICTFLITMAGCCLLVPGIILAVGLMLSQNLIVDQGLGGLEPMKKSWEMTKGHRINLFLFALLSFAVFLAGALACGVGALLVSAPVVVIAQAYIYLCIKGETPRLAQG